MNVRINTQIFDSGNIPPNSYRKLYHKHSRNLTATKYTVYILYLLYYTSTILHTTAKQAQMY